MPILTTGCGPGSGIADFTTFDSGSVGANITLSNGNRTINNSGSSATGGKSLHARSVGKFYFEVTVDNRTASTNNHAFGFMRSGLSYSDVGTSAIGILVYRSGFIFFNSVQPSGSPTIGTAWSNSDRIDVALDLDNSSVWFRQNGGNWNNNGSADPASNTSGVSFADLAGAWEPVWVSNTANDECAFNFGQTSFVGSAPSGFTNGWRAITPATNAGGNTTLVSSTKVNVTLSNGNLTATHSNTSQAIARSPHIRASGKYYFEYTVGTWTDANSGCGTASYDASGANISGAGLHCCFVFRSGNIWSNNANSGKTLGSVANGDRIDCAIDLDNLKVWFRKNGGNWNGDAAANPATNTNGVSTSSQTTMSPCVTFTGTASENLTGNFGDTSFVGTAPSGFTSGWTAT